MAHLVLFVLVFAGQLIGGFSIQKQPPSNNGKLITILSIDGGGIKAIIPATVLDYLDKALKAKDPTADLADYFDVMGGTSTGSITTAMLATPSLDDPTRPAYTPAQILDFYKLNGPRIFNPSRPGNGPLFDGEGLHGAASEALKETRVGEALTNLVIPAFDIKKQKPFVFSSYKLEKVPYLNAFLSDICISTSTAPTQFPPYYFENNGVEFNLVDGGEAAVNPTQIVVSEVLQQNEDPEILVLSLGTGATEIEEIYDADQAATWPKQTWAVIDTNFQGRAYTAITEYYLSSIFSGFQSRNTYLRVQEYDLNPDLSDPVNVTKASLDGLEETGKQLLMKKMVTFNLDTFDLDEGLETYAQALDRIADILHGERQRRRRSKYMEKGGRPFLETLAQAD
ncbi:hypothetical protein LR48_Vigan11g164300 [Vigna angularis]|uniref:Patatin n=1 Tax=Phaseolus angularis TaxID=3914 RepID=A0A0L9VUZ8_PHAAN|nr:patatin-17 [Vigna angularis]KAG2381131.1 Patatin-17 protein [Vigna angularis]KOM58609.1 hypothetical protein LR48_Vigan11g164300 [Vigna angularis]